MLVERCFDSARDFLSSAGGQQISRRLDAIITPSASGDRRRVAKSKVADGFPRKVGSFDMQPTSGIVDYSSHYYLGTCIAYECCAWVRLSTARPVENESLDGEGRR